MTTIAAIATPLGNAGVGIIRLSGTKSLGIISRCFDKSSLLVPRLAVTGQLVTPFFQDKIIVIYFQGPNSFTGEDIIEIHAHGGFFALQKILEHLYSLGATPAQPGEFSRRAFLNGKLTLACAEGLIELIHSESESQLAASSIVARGKLAKKIKLMEDSLVQVSAQIEATLDYPEYDIEHTTKSQIKPLVKQCLDGIDSLLATANQGRLIANGISVAVLGKPNVGKSSLFNALLDKDRSIVTDIAGTTTDTISETILYKGVRIVLNDTAGLRHGSGKIERLGIERTKKIVEECDVVLGIFDSSAPLDKEDNEILELCKRKKALYVFNKSDIKKTPNKIDALFVSALTGENVEQIKEEIYKLAVGSAQLLSNSIVITNARHLNELNLAKAHLSTALTSLESQSLDCVATDVMDALKALGNISGTHATQAVIDAVFSRFCLGK